MDYCIYKTIDGVNPRVIHTFTQEATGRKAKRTAEDKLQEMWLRVCTKPDQFHHAKGNKTEFSYSYPISTSQVVTVRFYIAPAPKAKRTTK